MTKTQILFLLILSCLMSSCMTLVQAVFGIKDAQKLTEEQIVKTSQSFHVDQQNNYLLDTSYLSYILNLDTTLFKAQRKNHLQPLQALYFDSSGKLVKFYINCYAGGFPNITWNRNGNLETFLPKDQAPIDTVLNLKRQLSFIQALGLTKKELIKETQDYTVFVYWNKCTKRHSKRLIRVIKENVAKAKLNRVQVIYVNYDNIFYALENKKD